MQLLFKLVIPVVTLAIASSCASKLSNLDATSISPSGTNVMTSDLGIQPQGDKALTAEEIDSIAQNITVKITDQKNNHGKNGSGVIIAREGNTYFVLTAYHVIKGIPPSIRTFDGVEYSATVEARERTFNADLAVLKFTSDQDYQVATIADYDSKTGNYIFVSGYPAIQSERLFSTGVLFDSDFAFWISQGLSEKPSHELLYGNITYPGMSGGPILDTSGRVIGVHGNSEGELDTNIVLGYGKGIPISTFLKSIPQLGFSLTPNKESPVFPGAREIASITSFLNVEPPTNSQDANDWFDYGIKLIRIGQLSDAVTALEAATNISPDFYQAWYAKGRALGGSGNFDQAIEAYDKAIELQAEFLAAWRLKGFTLSHLDRHEEAIECYRAAIEIEPHNFFFHHFLGDSLQELGLDSEAIDAYTKALENQTSATTVSNRGVSYYQLGNFKAAIHDFQSALNNNPGIDDEIRAYVNRGNTYNSLGNFQSAIEDYTKAINLYPKLPSLPNADIEIGNVYYDRGFANENLGNLDQAFSDYSKVIELNPKDSQAYYSRGNVRATQKKLNTAIEDWNKSLALNSQFPEAHKAYNNIGYALSLQGDWQEALKNYNQSILLNSNFPISYHNRGNAYKEVNNKHKALEDFQKAAQLYQAEKNLKSYQKVQQLILALQQNKSKNNNLSAGSKNLPQEIEQELQIQSTDPWNIVVAKAISYRQLGHIEKAIAAFSDYGEMFAETDPTAEQYSEIAQQFTQQLAELRVDGGVYLFQLIDGQVASQAGLAVGDIVINYNGETISNMNDFASVKDSAPKEVPLPITYLRMEKDGQFRQQTVNVQNPMGAGFMPI